MAIPVHTLNIYQKPKLGTGFVRRLPVYNYQHSINAIGWYDTASCDIALGSKDEGQLFLDQMIGNRVAVYVDNPVEPAWEGFINRMAFSAGGAEYTISLDEMANRVLLQLIDASSSATIPAASAVANNTDSQGIYGIKQDTIDFPAQTTSSAATNNARRDTQLVRRTWPQKSITRGGGNGLLHIEMLGFYHTLNWESFRDSTSALTQLGSMLSTVLLPNLANGTTFFDNTDFTDIATNTLTLNRQKRRGETIWQVMMEIQEIGDGVDYYILGLTPTLFQTGTRRLYYRTASSDIAYTARQSDGLRVRDLYGKIVPPWTVQPDKGIRISDMLIGWNGLGDNPTETYIESVTYDANQQTVDWQGDDDTTAEGVFNFKRLSKAVGKRFGAPQRLV